MDELSLFSSLDEPEVTLPVARFGFQEASMKSWEELFDGFNTLEAITFSSGLTFMNDVLKKFDNATIILGSDKTISMELSEIIAFQTATLQDLNKLYNKRQSRIHDMMKKESLHFWIAKTKMSHEKLYILTNTETGATRVIFGSANFSRQAFTANQRELICYMDNDEEGYLWFKSEFEVLKEMCCDMIPYEKIAELHQKDMIEELPFAQNMLNTEDEINVEKLLIVEPAARNEDEIRFKLDVEKLNKRFKLVTPVQPKNKTLSVIPEMIRRISRKLQLQTQEEEEQSIQNPEFTYDIEHCTAIYNGTQLDLHPSAEDIRQDADLYIQYMNGFDQFCGKTKHMQREYFKFLIWFFCSPFMAKFRLIANQADKTLDPYPVFALVYGSSKAGKTTYVKTLYKMTYGVKKISHAGDFTARLVEGMKRSVKGVPLFYDDVISKTFNEHAVKLIKHEDFGLDEYLDEYPCVVITGNEDIKAVEQYVSRRVALCHVTAGITNMKLIGNSVGKTIQRKIGTALYREYLRRFLERLPEQLSLLQKEDHKDIVDIIALSSDVFCEVLQEYATEEIPDYMSPVTLVNFFDEHQTSATAIDSIRESWITSPEMFSVFRKKNILQITFDNANEARTMKKQIPVNLCPEVTKCYLRINLKEAEAFFGIRFKKGLFR